MNNQQTVTEDDLPALYQAANEVSIGAQNIHFACLGAYLTLMILITIIFFLWPKSSDGAFASLIFFLVALGVLIVLRVKRYDDMWYNGRAVAESVKTRAWRWMMRAEPYGSQNEIGDASKQFVNDLRAILAQNQSLPKALSGKTCGQDSISETMKKVRAMPLKCRIEVYRSNRVQDQASWYSRKALLNLRRARVWFWVSVVLNLGAVTMLLFRVRDPNLAMPIPTLTTAASSVLTWLEARKHNELASSYSLAAYEIDLINDETLCGQTDKDLSDYVIDAEAAFSREHTQWAARRSEQACKALR